MYSRYTLGQNSPSEDRFNIRLEGNRVKYAASRSPIDV